MEFQKIIIDYNQKKSEIYDGVVYIFLNGDVCEYTPNYRQ